MFYAVTVNDAVHVLVRKLAYNSLKELSSFVKKVRIEDIWYYLTGNKMRFKAQEIRSLRKAILVQIRTLTLPRLTTITCSLPPLRVPTSRVTMTSYLCQQL